MSVGYLELLRQNRGFRQLWLGQVVSQLGDWFDTIAVMTLVLNLTGSGRDVGLIMVARFLPSVIVGPLSGVVADRFNRRTIMIVSDLLRAVVVLGFLFVRRPDQIWIIYALTVLQLTFSTFFEPAKSAVIPSIVRPPRPKTKLTLRKALGITDTLEGIRYVKTRPRVLALLAVKPAWGLGGGILALLAVFGEKVFPIGRNAATGIGVLYAARGIGTALGPVFARRLAGDNRTRMQTIIGLSFLVGGVFYAAFGGATNYALALIMLMIAHMGGSILWVFSTVLLQTSVEDNFRGRVFAAELALLTLTMAASNYVVGELLDRFNRSPRSVTIGIGGLFLLPGLLWFATARWWNRDDKQLPQTSPTTNELPGTSEVALRETTAKIHLSSD
ncbi:MAG: MFS transporter [Acidobacteria bacterium]|nr:MFS transporter [Acidobacteriota bacterium]